MKKLIFFLVFLSSSTWAANPVPNCWNMETDPVKIHDGYFRISIDTTTLLKEEIMQFMSRARYFHIRPTSYPYFYTNRDGRRMIDITVQAYCSGYDNDDLTRDELIKVSAQELQVFTQNPSVSLSCVPTSLRDAALRRRHTR